MTRTDFVKCVEERVISYRKDGILKSVVRNGHMNYYSGEQVSQETLDAIMVDFINFVAAYQGIDYAMHVSDLPALEKDKDEADDVI
jgi:hypothetical protein